MQEQLFDAGGPVKWWLRRWDRRVINGENQRRMRMRSAKKLGLTLVEYEQRRAEQVAERQKREVEKEERRRYREAQRLTPEQRQANRSNYNHKWYKAAYARDPSAWYAGAYRRRARLKSAPLVEEIRRHDVFDRDGWRCRNCGRKVSDKVKRGHPRKAIMAHIVALAAGGDHSWVNVCCLCHECNCRDGVNRLPLQLAVNFEKTWK